MDETSTKGAQGWPGQRRPAPPEERREVSAGRAQRAKDARRKKRRADRAAARGRRVQLAKAPAPVDIRRNVHVERGRAVTLNDIRPYARPKCSKCGGKGISKLMTDAAGEKVGAMPCKCAHERFMKAHPEIIVEATGAAFWPADGGPYQVIAEAGTTIEQRATRPPEPGEMDETANPPAAGTLLAGEHETPVEACLCVRCRP